MQLLKIIRRNMQKSQRKRNELGTVGLTSAQKKFLLKIESTVKNTIRDYSLISKNDKVLVAVSGGKDSTVLLYILKKMGYKIEALTINSFIGNYSKESLENITKFCEDLGVKLHNVSLRDEFGYSLCYIRSILNSKGFNIKSCTICGVLRRYLLNKYARKLGATKLVLGHNLDDEAQVIMMNFIRGDVPVSARLGPMTGVIKNKKFVPRIKPLYLVREKDIAEYSKIMKFPVKYGECPCSADSLRRSMKSVFNELEKEDPDVREKIVHSFLKTLPKLKKLYKNEDEIAYCSNCGEPTQKQMCKTCQILQNIKS
jgi:uncharacterized protein (TIGR00269 family)